MVENAVHSKAEEAGKRALEAVFQDISAAQNFKLEAGAGAGKTYSLVEALKHLIKGQGELLLKKNQKIACITFTNVAKDEIESRTDNHPAVYCDTIHGFCWEAISGFQSYLRTHLLELDRWNSDPWAERLEEAGGVGNRTIEYQLGQRGITDTEITLHHDDVLPLAITLFGYEKFRNLFRFRYPIILIDEYQDTDASFVASVREQFFGLDGPPLFGFFGDHWQKIYGNGCGALSDPSVHEIGKEANFRSVAAIVDCLNRMRPELPQFVVDPEEAGEVRIFHSNDWKGERLTGPHYGGDLPDNEANAALATVKDRLSATGWDMSAEHTKILLLTHRALGKQQGYSNLPAVFRDNNSFTKKEQPHVAFFVDRIEPACRAFKNKRYGEMFLALGVRKRHVTKAAEKKTWFDTMERLVELRESGSVAEVVRHVRNSEVLALSGAAEKLEYRLEVFDESSGDEMLRSLKELRDLHDVPYQEIVRVASYLDGHSPFETQHGVKGAQFENVLVVVGRGWNRYNFGKMLENVPQKDTLSDKDRTSFENNRNLFYVACSRPKRRLALLFSQELSANAVSTIQNWFKGVELESIF